MAQEANSWGHVVLEILSSPRDETARQPRESMKEVREATNAKTR